MDNKQFFALLYAACLNTPALKWVEAHLDTQNGRQALLLLDIRRIYEGEGMKEARVEEAKKIKDDLQFTGAPDLSSFPN